MGVPATLDPLVIAEDAWAYVPSSRPDDLVEDHGDVVLLHSPLAFRLAGGAHRVRFTPFAVDDQIRFVRSWMAAHGRDEFAWMIGPSTTPPGLEARLLADGATPDPDDPVMTPMALDHEPPAANPGIEIRRIVTFEDYGFGREITNRVAGVSDEDLEWGRAHAEEHWAYAQHDGLLRYLALIDGNPVAAAMLAPIAGAPPYLAGAATLPSARGRGAYKALVRARWDAAVAMGNPGLIIQAGKNSRPILERMGFRSGPPVHVVIDRSCHARRSDGSGDL